MNSIYNDLLIKEIKDALESVDFKNSRNSDTREVKNKLVKLANKNNINVWTLINKNEDIDTNAHLANHEWLFDLIWYKYDNSHYSLTEIILAMESEWGGRRYKSVNDNKDQYGEVKYDFQKLLVCNSVIKLMVFKMHGKYTELTKLLEYFQERINNSTNTTPKELFLFANYYKDKEKYRCKFIEMRKSI